MCEMVGSDSSSATKGWAMASVAGKNGVRVRAWACAPGAVRTMSATAASSRRGSDIMDASVPRSGRHRDGDALVVIERDREGRSGGGRSGRGASLGDAEGAERQQP